MDLRVTNLCVLKVHNAYNTKIQKFQGGSRCKLMVHNAYNTKMQKLQGGHSGYKLLVPSNFTTTRIQRYNDTEISGGHSRYRLLVSLKSHAHNTKIQTIQGGRS